MVGKIDALLLPFLGYVERVHVHTVADKDKIYSLTLVHYPFPKTVETIFHTFTVLGYTVSVVQLESIVQRWLINRTVSLAAIHVAH